MQRIVVPLVIVLLAVPVGVFAQDPKMNGCEDCAIARVGAATPLVGVLRQTAAREAARVAITLPTVSQQPSPPQRRRWIGRHPVLAGALIGAGSGFAAVYAISATSEYDEDRAVAGQWGLVYGAPIGAGLGAATGFVVSLIKR